MTPTLTALVGFAAWTVLLVFSLANVRVMISMRGEKALNTFSADGSDLEGFGQRLTRAHLNCLEFLPIFGAIAIAATASGQLGVTDPLAMVLLYARLGQTITHIASTATPAVLARATFFVVQLGIAAYWSFQLLTG